MNGSLSCLSFLISSQIGVNLSTDWHLETAGLGHFYPPSSDILSLYCRAGSKGRVAIAKDTVSMNRCCLKAFSSYFDKQAKIRSSCKKDIKEKGEKSRSSLSMHTHIVNNVLRKYHMLREHCGIFLFFVFFWEESLMIPFKIPIKGNFYIRLKCSQTIFINTFAGSEFLM